MNQQLISIHILLIQRSLENLWISLFNAVIYISIKYSPQLRKGTLSNKLRDLSVFSSSFLH